MGFLYKEKFIFIQLLPAVHFEDAHMRKNQWLY